ncbi:alpha-tocopherol transfer protein-like [Musca autumnalis]|uniref:alpha-tocopherol transfer protein-like n=1 Tax=Musca autumnalis TaxID=221902 RepID=UPI003CEFF9EA
MYKILKDLPQLEHEGFLFKLDYGEPSEIAKSVAKEELRETPEYIEKGLRELRSLLKAEPNLTCPLDNDLWLLSFLRPAHFNPEGAIEIIKKYYNYRQKYPELCKDLKLDTVKEVMLENTGSMLPQRDQYGRRIFISLHGKYWNPKKFTLQSMLQSFILQCEYYRAEPETQISGIVIILDVEGLKLQQVFKFTPNFIMSLVQYIQEGMGLRFKGYHVVNNPKIFDMIFAMTKPFIQEKMYKRIYFHGSDMSSLHRYISPDCLPECYGGTLKAARQSYGPQLVELFEKYSSDFDEFKKYGYQ